jgi:hypothetical protein
MRPYVAMTTSKVRPARAASSVSRKWGIAVNVLDVVRNVGNLVGAAMEDRDRVAAVLQPSDEKRSAWTGATHNESSFH